MKITNNLFNFHTLPHSYIQSAVAITNSQNHLYAVIPSKFKEGESKSLS